MTQDADHRPPEPDPAQRSIALEEERDRLLARLAVFQQTLADTYALYDQKIEELSLIRRVGDSVRTPQDLDDLALRIVGAVAHEISVERLALLLVAPHGRNARVAASHNGTIDQTRNHEKSEAPVYNLDPSSPLGRAWTAGEPVLTAAKGPDVPLGRPDDGRRSLLVVPLTARGRVVGLLSLSRPADEPFSDNDLRVLTIIGDQAGAALANQSLLAELRVSEQNARRTSRYLERLLDAAGDAILTLDHRRRVTYANPRVEEWGYDRKELTGRSLDELLETPDRSKHPPRPAGALKSHTAESVVRAADGRLRDVLLTTSQIEGEDDRGDVWLVLARDVTERKQLERQLFHSEKLASIGILAAGVAHEVGNPLSAVSGYTQILQNDDAVPDHAKEHLAAIESQTARIQRIIQDLLDYSRPSAGVRSGVNLPAALPEILSILAAQKLFKKISVAYDFEADLPEVIVDRDHLTQMVVNVALNAAQAMDGVGRLTVGARKRGAGVDVFVSDTGPGVPEKVADRVFDPFFTTKTSGRGTGLGLAICQRIAESNGGGIHLEPGSQPGATFVIHLPLAPSEEN